jgi:hypothetical protein
VITNSFEWNLHLISHGASRHLRFSKVNGSTQPLEGMVYGTDGLETSQSPVCIDSPSVAVALNCGILTSLSN